MIKTIIIDDETRSIATLKNLIRDYCTGLEVIATAESVHTGIELLEKETPDLLFLDIAMPDGTGFELLERLDQKKFEVIFTTAFEQYAIKAFDFSAMHYLLKPINPEQLQSVVELYKQKSSPSSYSSRYEILEEALDNRFQKIALPCIDGIEFVPLDDIIYCQADSNYCTFHLVNKKSVMVSRSLSFYEKLLQDAFFFRVHHKYMVNLKYVQKYVKGSGGYIILNNGVNVDVSVRRKDSFLKKMMALTGH